MHAPRRTRITLSPSQKPGAASIPKGTSEQVVIPAKAGFSTAELVIHLDVSLLKLKQKGFPLSRE
jgi:hypothetical protein